MFLHQIVLRCVVLSSWCYAAWSSLHDALLPSEWISSALFWEHKFFVFVISSVTSCHFLVSARKKCWRGEAPKIADSVTELMVKRQGNTPPQHPGKIDQNWAFDLVFTVFCVYHHSRSRNAKGRKTCFSSRAAWRSSPSCYVGRRTGICMVYVFPQAGINDFAISVFQAMRHNFFQPHPRPI